MSKVLSFGLIKELYSILKDDDKIAIKDEISNFDDINDLIDFYIHNNNNNIIISKIDLLKEMSLPNNFLDLKWCIFEN